MAGLQFLSDAEAMWLLVIAVPKKAGLATTMPIAIQRSLMDRGLIQINRGPPRATAAGMTELLKVML